MKFGMFVITLAVLLLVLALEAFVFTILWNNALVDKFGAPELRWINGLWMIMLANFSVGILAGPFRLKHS